MDIFSVGVCAVCAVVFGALIQKSNKEYALILSLGTAAIILLTALEQLGPLLSQVESLAGAGAFPEDCLGTVLKAVGIAAAGQLASDVCRDAGESAMARAVDLAARTAILACALPLVLRIFEILEEILQW